MGMHIQGIDAQIVTRQLETLEDLAECQFMAVSEDYYILYKAKEKSFSNQKTEETRGQWGIETKNEEAE